jgi:hypothetical protein
MSTFETANAIMLACLAESRQKSTKLKCQKSNVKIMKKKGFLEVVIRMAIAALTAALTALGTTSCMGYGPF